MTALAKLPDAIRALAEVIRKHGTCPPAALDHVADELTAALSPAELGGVEAYCYVLAGMRETVTGELNFLCNVERQTPSDIPLYTTPRAAEAVTDGEALFLLECADTLAKDFRHHMADKLREFVKQKALTPPSAKGE